MRSVTLAAIVVFSIVSVHAGLLVIDTSFSNGTILSASWLQGVAKSNVHYVDGTIYRQNMTIISGPNRCFVYGADGNDRAILIEPQSDDRGPQSPDAVVDCRICGCEDNPGTRFTCTSSGACASCDPCASETCNAGEICVRETCSDSNCICDPIQCSGSVCEEKVSVVSACAQDRCETQTLCIEGACGAECNDDDRSTRNVCDGTLLVKETTTCSKACTSEQARELITDCSQRTCPEGRVPACERGGCTCR